MADKKLRDAIKYEIMDEDPDAGVFDTSGDVYLAMREVSWNDGAPKLELRKWYAGHEDKDDFPGKGFSFLTDEGVDNLAELLVQRGFGNTDVLLDAIGKREEINDELIDSDHLMSIIAKEG